MLGMANISNLAWRTYCTWSQFGLEISTWGGRGGGLLLILYATYIYSRQCYCTVLLCLSCMSKPYTTTAMCTEICRLLQTRTVLLRTIVTKGCICKQNRFSIRTFNYFKFPAHISIMHDPNCLVQDSCFKLSASCCLIQAVLFKLADTSCLIQAV